MKKILVTGGAGFIGSHLCRYLLDIGHEVMCLDNFHTGDKENIRDCMDYNRFVLLTQDITEALCLGVDEIYNLACPASPDHYQRNGIYTLKTSILGAINVLDLAHKMNAKILQASTSEVYGDPVRHPQKEDYFGNVNPVGPRACYDEGKRCSEALFYNYRQHYGVNTKIVRIFNTYGENMAINDGRVVSNFIVQAINKNKITIYGDGTQTRSFQYVSDLISGLVKMMESRDSFMGPVNLGNPVEFTVKELADMVIEMTESKSKIVYLPKPQDDPCKRKPDISLAKEELHWEPVIPLREGLLKTIEYFKNLP